MTKDSERTLAQVREEGWDGLMVHNCKICKRKSQWYAELSNRAAEDSEWYAKFWVEDPDLAVRLSENYASDSKEYAALANEYADACHCQKKEGMD